MKTIPTFIFQVALLVLLAGSYFAVTSRRVGYGWLHHIEYAEWCGP